MKNSIAILCLLILHLTVHSQVTIRGYVRERGSNAAVDEANVVLASADGKSVYKYYFTKSDGAFEMTYNGTVDSLLIMVTGFNIEAKRQPIARKSQTLDIHITRKSIQLQDVVVRAQPITRRSDTLSYVVGRFADQADRTIGDVLKKMPGISVAKSGEVSYNGKNINKFYIEDMDMLGGRYGIATNNIRSSDIASVQVYENHQPIKSLKEIETSENAAINLKLKDEVKGTFNATMQLGAGYSPAMWNVEVVLMYFARVFQTIDTYKSNNMGDDVSRELKSFYNPVLDNASRLRVQQPSPPPLPEERFLRNNIHTASINTINKINKDLTITTNAIYLNDYQTASSQAKTTYFMPDETELQIVENTDGSRFRQQAEVNLEIRSNAAKQYITDKISISLTSDRDRANTKSDDEHISQSITNPRHRLVNDFAFNKTFRKFSLRVVSLTEYSNNNDSELEVTPLLFTGLFDAGNYRGALQRLSTERFISNNRVSGNYSVRGFNLSLAAVFNARIESMHSSLNPLDRDFGIDSLQNRTNWSQLTFGLMPNINYSKAGKFDVTANFNMSMSKIHHTDQITDITTNQLKSIFSGSLRTNITLSPYLKLNAGGLYNSNIGSPSNLYSGYIMTSYRVINRNAGELAHNNIQNYNLTLSYSNVFKALFASVDGSYRNIKSNLLYRTSYSGSLSSTSSFLQDNAQYGYGVSATLGWRLDAISSTTKLTASFSRSTSELMRQDVLMKAQNDYLSLAFEFTGQISEIGRFDYSINYGRTQSLIIDANRQPPIDNIQQAATLHFFIGKIATISLLGEHFYNSRALSDQKKSMFFADAKFSYRAKRIEYTVEARNLFNTRYFNSASYSDLTNYVYSYELRPVSVLFKIKFSIR